MSLSILSEGGLLLILRWIHFMAGITWIGVLYYFNFIQGPYFNETDAASKSAAIQKLVPRALWWFRWGAMFTFLSGITYIGMAPQFHNMQTGLPIFIGALLGTLMFLNVWLIIWPAQKVVIASTTQVAQGKPAIPEAAARATRSGIASRTNVLFSIPMLFFMGTSAHLGIQINPEANLGLLWLVILVIIGAIELNAIKGKMGPMASIKGVIHLGLALTLVLYLVVEFLTK